jgi:hypothetical protein
LYARDPEDFLKCREIQNILYPYGHYLGESQEIYYPSTLDLTKWCHQCDDKAAFMNDDDDNDADADSPDNDFSNTNSDITGECEDCPKVDDSVVNPSTGHKPNCECCKRNSSSYYSSSSSYLREKNTFAKPNCGLCMNTQSLFLRH